MNDTRYEIYRIEKSAFIILKKEFQAFNSCEIEWLVVSQKNQRSGIGEKLAIFVEKKAKELKFKKIYLYTSPRHMNAVKFYKKNGYSKINEFPDYYSNGERSILFGKVLK